MIVRPSGRTTAPRKKASRAVAMNSVRSSMGSDADDSDGSQGRGGYSDDSEGELEAGCMGVKDPREQKKERGTTHDNLRMFVCVLALLGFGAFLPYLLLAALDLLSTVNVANAGAAAGVGGGINRPPGAPGLLNSSVALSPVAASASGDTSLKGTQNTPSPLLDNGPWVRCFKSLIHAQTRARTHARAHTQATRPSWWVHQHTFLRV